MLFCYLFISSSVFISVWCCYSRNVLEWWAATCIFVFKKKYVYLIMFNCSAYEIYYNLIQGWCIYFNQLIKLGEINEQHKINNIVSVKVFTSTFSLNIWNYDQTLVCLLCNPPMWRDKKLSVVRSFLYYIMCYKVSCQVRASKAQRQGAVITK